jgi:hypothetical protein
MASSVRDFRLHNRTTITLPSGLEVLVRRCQLQDFLTLSELPVPASGQAAPARDPVATQRENRLIADLLIVHCALLPRFVARGEPEQEHTLGVDELETADYTALTNGILAHSGLAPEVAAEMQQFRPDAERPAGGADGGEVSRPAPHDHAGDPGGVLSGPAPGDAPGGWEPAAEPVAAAPGAPGWAAQSGPAVAAV